MIARNWPMANARPVLFLAVVSLAVVTLAVSGLSSTVVADGAKNCRQYVPGAGVTISVECGPPVAAVVLASAPQTCRRYIPGAGMSIEEACPEDVAPGNGKPVSPAQAPATRPNSLQMPLPSPVATPGGTPTKNAKPEKIDKAAAVIDAGKADTVTCSGALDRAQLGSETDRDLKALRSGCSSGG